MTLSTLEPTKRTVQSGDWCGTLVLLYVLVGIIIYKTPEIEHVCDKHKCGSCRGVTARQCIDNNLVLLSVEHSERFGN